MRSSCENCINAKFSRGACRGVMDCDPDEYWCDTGNDDIFCIDDNEELYELYGNDFEDLEDFIDNFECPDFHYRRDNGPDEDELYDRMMEERNGY